MADFRTTYTKPVGRASARLPLAAARDWIRKSLLSLAGLCLTSLPTSACYTPEMGSYFFWSKLSEELLEKEFAAKIRVKSFEPTMWEAVEYKLSDGTTHQGRQLISWPTIEFEVVELFRGKLDVTTSVQKLMVDSCNSGVRLESGDERFVAGRIVDGRPVLQKIHYHTGGWE
ncbi:hypothetical protein [Ruegeria sp. HKCCD8929]|uniref:hypothetical protein n=1 Tax=Ruegeria sp. HKCCD8929 TaxID=2683006 RepID=UPI0014879D57|nr:hypothetical protein [Ruegeria sp. HKCCD8929]